MDALLEIAIFAAKTLILIALLGGLALLIGGIVQGSQGPRDSLRVKDLNARYRDLASAILSGIVGRKEARKERKRANKADDSSERPVVFVLEFDGDVAASNVDGLREEISGILQIAREGDEVLIKVDSAGGTVTGYGLAAAQIRRLRERDIPVTVAVDSVAASGGYMMACTANQIIAAPFAIVGSIGVLAIVPNAAKALDNLGVSVHEFTAGKFKRTVTPFSEVTSEGREKFLNDLEETHQLFKSFVATNRPQLDIETVATGEHWHASQAIEFGLVDELQTSDDFLMARLESNRLVGVNYAPDRSFGDRIPISVASVALRIWDGLMTRANRSRLLS